MHVKFDSNELSILSAEEISQVSGAMLFAAAQYAAYQYALQHTDGNGEWTITTDHAGDENVDNWSLQIDDGARYVNIHWGS
jgi:hypothetical protein